MGVDVAKVVMNAFSNGYFDPVMAATLKVYVLSTFKEFQLISLCNILFKLFTKAVVLRLRPYWGRSLAPFRVALSPVEEQQTIVIIL